MLKLTLSGAAFVGLNLLRLLSVVASILVLASALEVMVLDGREVSSATAQDATVWDDCEYIPGTDVPTHTWGLFWAQLDRAFVMLLCILCVLSDINWGGYCERAFNHCLPVLGFAFGTGPLGALQMMIGANLLSHYLEDFPLVAAWLLFVVGFINFFLGIAIRRSIKDVRSFSPTCRARARGQLVTAPIDKLQRFAGDGRSPTPRTFFKASRWGFRQAFAPGAVQGAGTDDDGQRHDGALPIRNIYEAFDTKSGITPQELMRARAREANAKAEREAEARLAAAFGADHKDTRTEQGLSGAFVYDSARGTPVALGKAHSRYGSEHECAHSFAEHYEEMAPSPPYAAACTSETPPIATSYPPEKKSYPLPRSKARPPPLILTDSSLRTSVAYRPGRSPGASAATAAIKRRSLALAKAARKRLSAVGGAASSSKMPGSPARQKAARRLRRQQRSFASFASETTRNGGSIMPSEATTPRLPSLTKQRLIERAHNEREQLARLAKELKLESLPGSPRSVAVPHESEHRGHSEEPDGEHVPVPSRNPSTSNRSAHTNGATGEQVLPLRRSSSASASVYSQVTRPTALSLVSPMPSTQYRARRSSNGEESNYGHSNYRAEYDLSPTYSTTTAGALTSVSRAPRKHVHDAEESEEHLRLPVASRWQSEWTSAATFAAGKAARRQPAGP